MKVSDAIGDARSVFLDSAPVIYHVEGVPGYQAVTDAIFGAIQGGAISAVTSCITLAECLVHPYRDGDMALIERFRNTITAGAHTRYTGVDHVPESAAELRARYNLGLGDALQIAAAIAAGCDAFLTNDSHLKRVSELRVLVLGDLEPEGGD